MKRFLWFLLGLLALVSCNREGPGAFKGYYSFKTGGFLTITGTVSDWSGERDTSFVRHLVAESGQMHVLRKDGDNMIVTMNITGGDPAVFPAKVNGDEIVLEPVVRNVLVRPAVGDDAIRHDFTVSGKGRKYDNMILFDLSYEGAFRHLNLKGTVTGSEVKCIATENE